MIWWKWNKIPIEIAIKEWGDLKKFKVTKTNKES